MNYTHGQIEAAIACLRRYPALYEATIPHEAMADALEAAVGPSQDAGRWANLAGQGIQIERELRKHLLLAEARIAKLEAELDGPTAEQIEARWAAKFADAKRNIENKAIERCAQVALEWLTGYDIADLELVDSIRALKEKP